MCSDVAEKGYLKIYISFFLSLFNLIVKMNIILDICKYLREYNYYC